MNHDLLIRISLLAFLSVALASAEETVSTIRDDVSTLEVTTVSSPVPATIVEKVKRQSQVQQAEIPTIATKTPQPEKKLLPFVDTISGAELKQYQRYELADTLRQSAGVTLVEAGQKGSQTSIFIRGLESNHAVVLLNGRRLPPGLAGIYQLEYLDTATLESVQIIRGPASSLYGSDALAGAIDLKSTDARYVTTDAIETYIEAGSFDTLRAGEKLTIRDGKVGIAIDSNYHQTDNDRPFSHFENTSVRGNVAIDLADGVYFDLLGYIQSSFLQVPGSELSFNFPEMQHNRNQSALFSPRFTIERDDWEFTTFYSYSENELEATQDVFFQDNLLEQTGHEAEAVFHYHPTDHATYSLGAGYYEYEFARTPLIPGFFNRPSASQYAFTSIFGQADMDLPWNFHLLASARHDEHNSFESKATYSVALSHEIEATGTTLFGKVATGYKAPSGQDFVFLAPTVDPFSIQPEESESWEVGIRQDLPNDLGSIAVTYFQADIENLVDVDPFFFAFATQVDTATQGYEVELRLQPCDFLDIYGTYTYLDATITDGQYLAGFGGNPGDRLPRRPEHMATAGATFHGDHWTFGAEIQGAYSRFDGPGVFLDDYTLARIFGSVDLCEKATLYGRVENVFDTEYQSTTGFTGAGVGAFAGIRFLFGE